MTRYSDVRTALADKRLTRDPLRAAAARAEAGLPVRHRESPGRGTTLLECDPPRHTSLRKAVNPEFATRRIAQLRPRIEHTARGLVDEFRERGTAELVEQFALPLTVSTLCDFVGIPFQDWERFSGWVHDVHAADPSPAGARHVAEAITAMDTYFSDLLDRKRGQRPSAETGESAVEDFFTGMISAESGARLSDDDLVAMGRSLLVGGYDSTKSLIITGMLGLLTHPEQLRILHADPALIPQAIEEFLRYDPPFSQVQERYALDDIVIGEVLIPRGQPLIIDLAAANSDPRRFRHGTELDITDVDRGHVAFGPGIHHCLGAALARLEAEIAFHTLLLRLPDITLDATPEDLPWSSGILAGPSTLPVRFDSAASVGTKEVGRSS